MVPPSREMIRSGNLAIAPSDSNRLVAITNDIVPSIARNAQSGAAVGTSGLPPRFAAPLNKFRRVAIDPVSKQCFRARSYVASQGLRLVQPILLDSHLRQ